MLRASTARSPALRAAAACALALLAIGLGPGRALAHAELVESTPPASGTVLDAPDQIEMRFSEAIDPDLAFVDVVDATQQRVDGLGPVTVVEDGLVAQVPLPDLEPGVYTVTYQVVSTVDGHATAGAFAFVIDPTGSEAPPATPANASTPAVDGWAIGARWVGLAGALVTVGGCLAWWRSRRLLAADVRPPWGVIAGAALIGYAGIAAYLWLSGRPIVEAVPARGDGLPFDFAAPFGATAFATAMRVAMAGALITAVLAAVAGHALFRRRSVVMGLTTLTAGTTLGGMSMAAHAAAAGGIGFGLVDWAHLAAVGAWLGALPALVVLARRSGGTPTIGTLLRHHGPVALIAAPVVALTGIANSPLVLGSGRGLVASDYGNLLLAKAVLLSVALGIGAVNHLALRGRGRARVAVLVGAELIVAVLAVGAAATLVTIQPSAARQPAIVAAPIAPAHLFGEAGPTTIHATINLPTPGVQRYLVTVTDAESGAPRDDIQLVYLEMTPPDGTGLPSERLDLEEDGARPGLYAGEGAYLGVEGEWAVDVVVRRQGALDERAAFVVPVQEPAAPQRVPPPDTGLGIPAPVGLLWGILPAGPAGWLPSVLALAALAATGLTRRRGTPMAVIRGALVVVALVGMLGAGSRAVVAVANLPGSGELAEHVPDPGFVGSVEVGRRVYLANCAACHGVEGDGDGPIGTLPPAGGMAEPVTRMTPGELSYRIANGLAGTPMPAFAGSLTVEERWHLVNYLEGRWTGP